MTQQLRIPYLTVQPDANSNALIASALGGSDSRERLRRIKIEALRTLDIEVDDNTPDYDLSDVWGRHIHKINGLEFSKPFHPDIVDVIRSNSEVYKFFFFLT